MTDIEAEFRNARADPGLVILEGFHALKHALRFNANITLVAATEPGALEALAGELAPDLAGLFSTKATHITDRTLQRLSRDPHHTGVISIAVRPRIGAGSILHHSSLKPIVFLENPRNLGNLGAVIRVAAAADVAGVITTGTNDPWDPLAIRGSAGLHFALPVAHVDHLPESDRPLVAVHPDGTSFRSVKLDKRSILAFGTERSGLSDHLLDTSDARISIPMRHGVSSLNLATSVAVMLYSQ